MSVFNWSSEIEEHFKLHLQHKAINNSDMTGKIAIRNADNCSKLSGLTVHITSVDGFFNRKRGRPPKNRYVQVYKNLQLPPQAVFTSFKLERTIPIPVYEHHHSMEANDIFSSYAFLKSNSVDIASVKFKKATEIDHSIRKRDIYTKIDKEEQKTVVRTAGTFYPESLCNKDTAAQMDFDILQFPQGQTTEPRLCSPIKDIATEKECSAFPQDLSIHSRTKQEVISFAESKIYTCSYLNMLNLMSWYSQVQEKQKYIAEEHVSQIRKKDSLTMTSYSSDQMQQLRRNEAVAEIVVKNLNTNSEPMNSTTIISGKYPNPMFANFSKQRFNTNCGVPLCEYRARQTHFHYQRKNPQYSFCDKARFLQHFARNKQLDTLLGTYNDLKRYRLGKPSDCLNCSHNFVVRKSSTRFNCIKCSLLRLESRKSSTHRRIS